MGERSIGQDDPLRISDGSSTDFFTDDAPSWEKTGATRRSRTGDLLITNQLLYRLS